MKSGCTSWNKVQNEMVFDTIDKKIIEDLNEQKPLEICFARHTDIDEDAVFLNALNNMPSCDIKDKTKNIEEIENGDKCHIYCAHEDCSAAAKFIERHAGELNDKCSSITYIHDGIKALQSSGFETRKDCPIKDNAFCTSLQGQNIVVTGGTRGLGIEHAKRALDCQANHVTITGWNNPDNGYETEKDLKNIYGDSKIDFVRADARTQNGNHKVFDPNEREKLSLPKVVHHAVLNAGIFGVANIADRGIDSLDEEIFDNVHQTNCKGVFLGIQEFANGYANNCKESNCPHNPSIVAIKSIYGSGASAASNAAYQSSKFCVDGLVKQSAIEFARPQNYAQKDFDLPHAIRVNSVSPGFAYSNMTDEFHNDPKTKKIIEKSQAHGKWVNPRNISKQVVSLMSAEDVSGTDIFVDGGTHAQTIPNYVDSLQLNTSKGCCGD